MYPTRLCRAPSAFRTRPAPLLPHSQVALAVRNGGASLLDVGCRRISCVLAAMMLTAGAYAQDRLPDRPPAKASACKLEPIGTGAVKSVVDGRTFVLTDGREVRLAGIEVPRADDGGAHAGAAKAALEALLAGGEILFKRLGAETDRYGRVVAYVFGTGQERAAQQVMLARGHARMAARIGDAACAAELLAAERTARAARLGLW